MARSSNFVVILACFMCFQYVEPRDHFSIDVIHKGKGDTMLPPTTVKAHLLEDLVEFLDLEFDESNFTSIVKELSSIPFNITVDFASSSSTSNTKDVQIENEKFTREYLPESGCLDYTPTYLFTFDREDIIDEFGSEYFLLKPSSEENKVTVREEVLNPKKMKQWLHVPKTGSSFEVAVVNLGFEDVGHAPCPLDSECELVTLFRDPNERLISWFYFSPATFDECDIKSFKGNSAIEYKEILQQCFNKFLSENMNGGSGKEVDRSVMFWGCEAKMVLGTHCIDADVPEAWREGDMLAQAAIARMRNTDVFKFIGITEFFEASVTLAHQMLGGDLELIDEFRKVNTRSQNEMDRRVSGNKQFDAIQYDSNFLCHNNELCKNLPDEAVYQETKNIMLMNILKHHNNAVRIVKSRHSMREPQRALYEQRVNEKTCRSPEHEAKIINRNKFIF